jgi:recombination protein RecR
MLLPAPVQNLIDAFSRLPGIGPKTASRIVFYLLHSPESVALDLAKILEELKANTSQCPICFNITQSGREACEICSDERRDQGVICVVEEPLDVFALERTGGFNGQYHVLHGVLSPIEGVGADDLRIKELVERVQAGNVKEIILATNPSLEGDATAMYLSKRLSAFPLRLTRLARGLPVGGDLEYADQSTLKRALDGRQAMDGSG